MRKILFPIFLLNFFFPFFCSAISSQSEDKIKVIYNSLELNSISQHLAFYELYPEHYWGKQALAHAWKLLTGNPQQLPFSSIPFSSHTIQSLVSLVNKPLDQEPLSFEEEAKEVFAQISSRLQHYNLKGHQIWSEEEILQLPLEEIDLARGLFISQFGENRKKIESYEALIDIMALQIKSKLSTTQATAEEKIRKINAFIFDEMGFRFPPHSLYAKDIDLYTFLPSVLDSRRGVCLGVSILYLCIAQRLGLSLEMITPPGHIYIRYRNHEQVINIETTARGIHIESEEYLGINTCALQERTIKEVIGMAHFNQASVYWQNGEYEKALKAYERAEPYMQDDILLKELKGYTLLLTNQTKEGERLLQEIKDIVPQHEITKSTMAQDYLAGNVDAQGIAVLFARVDENRKSILEKKAALEATLKEYPHFRSGLLTLAVTWLQLHRLGEASEVLEKYVALQDEDPEAHYYLSVLYAMRSDYPKAWDHLHKTENIVQNKNHKPKSLKELRRALIKMSPE